MAMGIHSIDTLYPETTIKETAMAADESKPHWDDEDVPEALKRETQDGSGFESVDELPESDFDSFAEDDVEDTTEDPK